MPVRSRAWAAALLPLVAIVALIGLILAVDPLGSLRAVPPTEALAVERVELSPDRVSLKVRNDGPDPVTIAQVLVNEAYNSFEADAAEIGRLETSEIVLSYPWEPGLPLRIGMVTSTGAVFDHEIEAAALTPASDARSWLVYGLLGLFVGVIPVAVGLLFFPALRRASARWLAFFLALTVGLLVFLLVETVHEGLEMAEETAGSLNGVGLFAIGVLVAVAALGALESRVGAGKKVGADAGRQALGLSYLVATGIGLHNLGEGLAIGAASAAGEVALGTFLVVGFAVHNTTEGLAIVAPLGRAGRRPGLAHLAALGAVAGVPTILGAWAGGFSFSPWWAALAFGLAAGAIAQVVWQIARGMRSDTRSGLAAVGFVAGLLLMYLTGLFTA